MSADSILDYAHIPIVKDGGGYAYAEGHVPADVQALHTLLLQGGAGNVGLGVRMASGIVKAWAESRRPMEGNEPLLRYLFPPLVWAAMVMAADPRFSLYGYVEGLMYAGSVTVKRLSNNVEVWITITSRNYDARLLQSIMDSPQHWEMGVVQWIGAILMKG